ncbi:MAG TPA: AMP-binding protein [Solirubrobacteraceae bacterium]|jgi:acyl-CoA synthetase (AMP-forming)/AMP-acid ligase II|nr:AMP-binding protein [Solirubrobacteraceae bacterium]
MNIAMLLELPAAVAGDQTILLDDERELTYAQLREEVARLASLLLAHGVGPGDRVGIFATSSARVAEVLFAAAAIEAVAVPMNYRARHDEVAHLLADSQAKLVFTEQRYLEDLRHARQGDTPLLLLDGELAAQLAEAEPLGELASTGEDAVLMYTSGTTALPKGVRLTHEALSSFALAAGEMADGEERASNLIAVPLYHVAGLTTLLVSIFTGRRTYLQREFTPEGWLQAVARHRVSEAFLVPTMLKRVLDADVEAHDLSSLRMLRYGAAPMPETVIARALERFPSSTGFIGAYGLTETTSTVTVLGPEDHELSGSDGDVAEKRKRLRSVGRVLDDVELEIRGEDGEPLQAGEVGRVCLRSARAMRGYLGEDATLGEGPAGGEQRGGEQRGEAGAAPEEPGERWMQTGDLGYLDEGGYLFLVGRAGDMIIRGGENIAPQEVERILLGHPGVADAAVVGVPDEEWGQRVVAAVVAAPAHEVSAEALIERCRTRLAGFKRPERIHFVEELPHTSTGKLMRRKVLETLDAPSLTSS